MTNPVIERLIIPPIPFGQGALGAWASTFSQAMSAVIQQHGFAINNITPSTVVPTTESQLRGAIFPVPLTFPTQDIVVVVPKQGTIQRVIVFGQPATGSCVLDVLKGSIVGFPSAMSIVGTKPAIANARVFDDSLLSGWSRELLANDVLTFRLESANEFITVSIFLIVA